MQPTLQGSLRGQQKLLELKSLEKTRTESFLYSDRKIIEKIRSLNQGGKRKEVKRFRNSGTTYFVVLYKYFRFNRASKVLLEYDITTERYIQTNTSINNFEDAFMAATEIASNKFESAMSKMDGRNYG